MSGAWQDDRAVLETAIRWLDEGRRVAIATVVRTWGSSPRPPGSQLAVSDAGDFVGSVSGGCVEGAVIDTAGRVMETAEPTTLDFGVSDEEAWAVGLACGGSVRVRVDAVERAVLESLLALVRAERPVVLAIELETGRWAVLDPGADLPPDVPGALREAAADALAADDSRAADVEGRAFFLRPWPPPLRLVIVGAVHIAQPLAAMAASAGFRVVVVDPRRAFATEERFPGVELVRSWPDEAFETVRLDARTAVVTLTHDPKLDDPALLAALPSPVFYVGALGSRRTHARRMERLAGEGADPEALARIRGPVGLDIGARTPAEIAVAILAEAIEALRGKSA